MALAALKGTFAYNQVKNPDLFTEKFQADYQKREFSRFRSATNVVSSGLHTPTPTTDYNPPMILSHEKFTPNNKLRLRRTKTESSISYLPLELVGKWEFVRWKEQLAAERARKNVESWQRGRRSVVDCHNTEFPCPDYRKRLFNEEIRRKKKEKILQENIVINDIIEDAAPTISNVNLQGSFKEHLEHQKSMSRFEHSWKRSLLVRLGQRRIRKEAGNIYNNWLLLGPPNSKARREEVLQLNIDKSAEKLYQDCSDTVTAVTSEQSEPLQLTHWSGSFMVSEENRTMTSEDDERKSLTVTVPAGNDESSEPGIPETKVGRTACTRSAEEMAAMYAGKHSQLPVTPHPPWCWMKGVELPWKDFFIPEIGEDVQGDYQETSGISAIDAEARWNAFIQAAHSSEELQRRSRLCVHRGTSFLPAENEAAFMAAMAKERQIVDPTSAFPEDGSGGQKEIPLRETGKKVTGTGCLRDQETLAEIPIQQSSCVSHFSGTVPVRDPAAETLLPKREIKKLHRLRRKQKRRSYPDCSHPAYGRTWLLDRPTKVYLPEPPWHSQPPSAWTNQMLLKAEVRKRPFYPKQKTRRKQVGKVPHRPFSAMHAASFGLSPDPNFSHQLRPRTAFRVRSGPSSSVTVGEWMYMPEDQHGGQFEEISKAWGEDEEDAASGGEPHSRHPLAIRSSASASQETASSDTVTYTLDRCQQGYDDTSRETLLEDWSRSSQEIQQLSILDDEAVTSDQEADLPDTSHSGTRQAGQQVCRKDRGTGNLAGSRSESTFNPSRATSRAGSSSSRDWSRSHRSPRPPLRAESSLAADQSSSLSSAGSLEVRRRWVDTSGNRSARSSSSQPADPSRLSRYASVARSTHSLSGKHGGRVQSPEKENMPQDRLTVKSKASVPNSKTINKCKGRYMSETSIGNSESDERTIKSEKKMSSVTLSARVSDQLLSGTDAGGSSPSIKNSRSSTKTKQISTKELCTAKMAGKSLKSGNTSEVSGSSATREFSSGHRDASSRSKRRSLHMDGGQPSSDSSLKTDATPRRMFSRSSISSSEISGIRNDTDSGNELSSFASQAQPMSPRLMDGGLHQQSDSVRASRKRRPLSAKGARKPLDMSLAEQKLSPNEIGAAGISQSRNKERGDNIKEPLSSDRSADSRRSGPRSISRQLRPQPSDQPTRMPSHKSAADARLKSPLKSVKVKEKYTRGLTHASSGPVAAPILSSTVKSSKCSMGKAQRGKRRTVSAADVKVCSGNKIKCLSPKSEAATVDTLLPGDTGHPADGQQEGGDSLQSADNSEHSTTAVKGDRKTFSSPIFRHHDLPRHLRRYIPSSPELDSNASSSNKPLHHRRTASGGNSLLCQERSSRVHRRSISQTAHPATNPRTSPDKQSTPKQLVVRQTDRRDLRSSFREKRCASLQLKKTISSVRVDLGRTTPQNAKLNPSTADMPEAGVSGTRDQMVAEHIISQTAKTSIVAADSAVNPKRSFNQTRKQLPSQKSGQAPLMNRTLGQRTQGKTPTTKILKASFSGMAALPHHVRRCSVPSGTFSTHEPLKPRSKSDQHRRSESVPHILLKALPDRSQLQSTNVASIRCSSEKKSFIGRSSIEDISKVKARPSLPLKAVQKISDVRTNSGLHLTPKQSQVKPKEYKKRNQMQKCPPMSTTAGVIKPVSPPAKRSKSVTCKSPSPQSIPSSSNLRSQSPQSATGVSQPTRHSASRGKTARSKSKRTHERRSSTALLAGRSPHPPSSSRLPNNASNRRKLVQTRLSKLPSQSSTPEMGDRISASPQSTHTLSVVCNLQLPIPSTRKDSQNEAAKQTGRQERVLKSKSVDVKRESFRKKKTVSDLQRSAAKGAEQSLETSKEEIVPVNESCLQMVSQDNKLTEPGMCSDFNTANCHHENASRFASREPSVTNCEVDSTRYNPRHCDDFLEISHDLDEDNIEVALQSCPETAAMFTGSPSPTAGPYEDNQAELGDQSTLHPGHEIPAHRRAGSDQKQAPQVVTDSSTGYLRSASHPYSLEGSPRETGSVFFSNTLGQRDGIEAPLSSNRHTPYKEKQGPLSDRSADGETETSEYLESARDDDRSGENSFRSVDLAPSDEEQADKAADRPAIPKRGKRLTQEPAYPTEEKVDLDLDKPGTRFIAVSLTETFSDREDTGHRGFTSALRESPVQRTSSPDMEEEVDTLCNATQVVDSLRLEQRENVYEGEFRPSVSKGICVSTTDSVSEVTRSQMAHPVARMGQLRQRLQSAHPGRRTMPFHHSLIYPYSVERRARPSRHQGSGHHVRGEGQQHSTLGGSDRAWEKLTDDSLTSTNHDDDVNESKYDRQRETPVSLAEGANDVIPDEEFQADVGRSENGSEACHDLSQGSNPDEEDSESCLVTRRERNQKVDAFSDETNLRLQIQAELPAVESSSERSSWDRSLASLRDDVVSTTSQASLGGPDAGSRSSLEASFFGLASGNVEHLNEQLGIPGGSGSSQNSSLPKMSPDFRQRSPSLRSPDMSNQSIDIQTDDGSYQMLAEGEWNIEGPIGERVGGFENPEDTRVDSDSGTDSCSSKRNL